jgi:processive 1,2-diacylglycerol beta-glucosyltransferase
MQTASAGAKLIDPPHGVLPVSAGPTVMPTPGPRVLVLSAKFGGGHKSAAEALSAWWEAEADSGSLEVLDYYDAFVSPFVTQAASVGYTQSVRLCPASYGLFYEATRRLRPDSAAQQWLNNLGKRELAAYLRDHPADIIVGVHPTPCGALSDLRREGLLDVPVVSIITDYTVHSQWIHPGTDLYLVGSQEVAEGLLRRNVPPEKVVVTGIPVRVNTRLLDQREALREKWGLHPDEPTVLVMTGAQGMMRRPWRLFHTVAARPVQGFFLCGRDKSLLTRLKMTADRYPQFRIMPFVRIVPELMCVSDVLVSKAGGLTTSEALAMELPMILFHPIPGQEIANREYLVESGAALAADSIRDLGNVLDRVCGKPEQLAAMRAATRLVRRPDAAGDAGRQLQRLLRERLPREAVAARPAPGR